jgi:hypothetical protein
VKTVKAWHFVKDDGTNRDGIKERVGKWYKVDGEIVCCERGLHGSVRLLDALQYAPGAMLRRTEHRGTIIEQDDKLCSSERRALWQIDVTKALHLFACRVAEDALKATKVTDERAWNAIKVKRAWLKGKATDEELASARVAAWSADRSAACSAARSAASSAAWSADSYAARSAARSAAWSAARSAARYAACAAARSAAWSAAWSAQNRLLERMVMAEYRRVAKKAKR